MPYKAIVAVALLLAAFTSGWYVEGLRWETDRLSTRVKIEEAQKQNAELITKLGEQHAKSEAVINTLLDARAPRVRLPTCPSQTSTAEGGVSAVTTVGVLLDEAERILAEERQRIKGIVGEAEIELNDCRVVKEWAAQIK